MFRLFPYVIVVLLSAMSLRSFHMLDAIAEGGGFMNIVKRMKGKASPVTSPNISDSLQNGSEQDGSVQAVKPKSLSIPSFSSGSGRAAEDEKMKCVSMLTLNDFSYGELDILYKLQKRRLDIEKSNEWNDVKNASMLAIKNDIEQRLSSLEALQGRVKILLDEYKKMGDARILKLTRVYENMKPEEAAKVFETMNLELVANIANNMKDAKLALIVSAMAPDKAKGLSMLMVNKELKALIAE